MWKKLKERYQRLTESHSRVEEDVRGALAIGQLLPIAGHLRSYVPWTTSAVDPLTLRLILNDIVINSRRTVLELGAGLSTLFIHKLIDLNGLPATLSTIEEDRQWLLAVQEALGREGLAEKAHLTHAPVVTTETPGGPCRWYDTSAVLRAVDDLGEIDVLVVDGPLAANEDSGSIRGHAMSVLRDRLSERSCVFLHDVDRSEEHAVMNAWADRYGLRFFEYGKVGYAMVGDFCNIY